MARGDHIYVPTKFPFINHHGIDCGGNLVIEYSKNGRIDLVSKQAFAQGRDITTKHYSDAECLPSEFVVIRAYSRLGETEYSLLCNNCEHFASWCKTGNHVAEQLRSLDKLLCPVPDIRPIVSTTRMSRISVS